jgi:hypothetical protein
MKVALCFWGLTRSLKYTLTSIQKHILEPLNNANIEYKIFLHTFHFNSPYVNPRAQEINVKLDFNEYTLLNPDYVQIDDQDVIKQKIHITKYRTMPDPWESNYICVDNFVCAMYSKKKLGEMVNESGIDFDYIMYLRPDVKFINSFDVRYFSITKKHNVCTPNFHLFPKLNDRFCLLQSCNLEKYSNLFDEMYEFSTIFPLHSEKFQHYIMTRKYNWSMRYIPIHFHRVRANGDELKDTAQYYRQLNRQNISLNHAKQPETNTEQKPIKKKTRHPMFVMKYPL